MDNNGWPDPARPGVPLTLDRWRGAINNALTNWLSPIEDHETPADALQRLIRMEVMAALDPAVSQSAADLVAKAKREALEEAAREIAKLKAAIEEIARYHDTHAAHYETGERRFKTYADLAEAARFAQAAEAHKQRAAAIRALSATPPGTYTSEAEQERDEFFNRLGRITEELRLPMDATASRIIEAIRERVDNERDACASISVQVKVPDGAETWTPLEAWEEALLVFDEAFRDAIRSRALKGEGDE